MRGNKTSQTRSLPNMMSLMRYLQKIQITVISLKQLLVSVGNLLDRRCKKKLTHKLRKVLSLKKKLKQLCNRLQFYSLRISEYSFA